MAPAAHHRVIDAGGPIALDGDDDVQVLVARTVGELLVQHLGQRADLVAYLRRLLEGEVTVLKSVSSGPGGVAAGRGVFMDSAGARVAKTLPGSRGDSFRAERHFSGVKV